MAQFGFLSISQRTRSEDLHGEVVVDENTPEEDTVEEEVTDEDTRGFPGMGKVIRGMSAEDEKNLYDELLKNYTYDIYNRVSDAGTLTVSAALLYFAVSSQDNIRTALLAGVAAAIFLVYGYLRK